MRPRTGNANIADEQPCGHALVTDCHPAYRADVPDLARAHVTPKHYGEASKGPDRSQWTKLMQEELESLRKQDVHAFVNELPTGEIALRSLSMGIQSQMRTKWGGDTIQVKVARQRQVSAME